MDCSTIVNSAGLFFDAIGVFIVFKNTPIFNPGIDGGKADTDFDKIRGNAAKNNKNARYGFLIIMFGFVLQFISNFI